MPPAYAKPTGEKKTVQFGTMGAEIPPVEISGASLLKFQLFLKRKLQVTGFQELCLLCCETQWLRHSKAERVAQFVLFRLLQFNMLMYQI